jgi:hypothetical protein
MRMFRRSPHFVQAICAAALLVAPAGFTAATSWAQDMFASGERRIIPIFDPRIDARQIACSDIEGKLVVQGDIVLGTYDQTMRRSLRLAAQFARSALADAELERVLNNEQRQQLREIQDRQVDRLRFDSPQDSAALVNQTLDVITGLSKAADTDAIKKQSAILKSRLKMQVRWPSGVIPFEITQGCPNEKEIRKAIEHWHKNTDRIYLHEMTKGPKDTIFKNWVEFVASVLCRSEVGMLPEPGRQTIEVSPRSEAPQIIHEIGHAAGLFHEHCRSDREKSIKIEEQNIAGGMEHNFELLGDAVGEVGAFDFESIMLYPPKAFGNGKVTMVRLLAPNDTAWGILSGSAGGKTTRLSAGDIQGIEAMYPKPAVPPK